MPSKPPLWDKVKGFITPLIIAVVSAGFTTYVRTNTLIEQVKWHDQRFEIQQKALDHIVDRVDRIYEKMK